MGIHIPKSERLYVDYVIRVYSYRGIWCLKNKQDVFMTFGVAYALFIQRWNLGFTVLLAGIALVSAGFGSEEETVVDASDWEVHESWLHTDERVYQLTQDVEAAGFSARQVAFPTAGTPAFFRAAKFQELFNDLLAYLDDWLYEHGIIYPPIEESYDHKLLPNKPLEDFLSHVTWHDALLMPSLSYYIHTALSKNSPLSKDERSFLKFRLRYLNEVAFPDGMEIDWDDEYEELVKDYKEQWVTSIKIPSFSLVNDGVVMFSKKYKRKGMSEEKFEVLKESIRKRTYDDRVCMKTTWNNRLSLYDAHFDFDRLDQNSDPILKQYLLFSMAASLRGPYFYEEKLAASYWFKIDEMELELNENQKSTWKEKVNDFRFPEGEIEKINSKIVRKNKITNKPKSKLTKKSPTRSSSKPQSKSKINRRAKNKESAREPSTSNQEKKPAQSFQVRSLPKIKRIKTQSQPSIEIQPQAKPKPESGWKKGRERMIWPSFMEELPAQEASSSRSKGPSRVLTPLDLGVGSTPQKKNEGKDKDKDKDDLKPLPGDILGGIIQGIRTTKPPPIVQKNSDASPVLTCTPSPYAPANGMIWFSDGGVRRNSGK